MRCRSTARLKELEDPIGALHRRQVRRDGHDRHAGLALELVLQVGEPALPPGDDDEVRTVLPGEVPRHGDDAT